MNDSHLSSPADEARSKYSVPALEKGLDLLELLSDQASPMTQAQLGRALGRHPGEIFRMLTCLEMRGYLRRDAATGGYALSLKLFELSRTHSPHETLLQAARPLMRQLSRTLGESCHLSVLHHEQVLVLAQEESPKAFRLSVEVGSLHSPMRTTSGRLLLAFASASVRDQVLAAQEDWRSASRNDRTTLLAALHAIRRRGYERSTGERFVGGMDLGVLVGQPTSTTQAALTIAALQDHQGPNLDAMLAPLTACADAIASQAGLGPLGPA